MKTIVLVDLDNVQTVDLLEDVLQFYTKDTQFVFFGVGTNNNKKVASNCMNNGRKVSRIRDCFFFHKNQIDMQMINFVVPDGADMKMFGYAGKNICKWLTDGIQNILVVSGDKAVYNLAILLKQQFNTWLVLTNKHMISANANNSAKLGLTVPKIIMKWSIRCTI